MVRRFPRLAAVVTGAIGKAIQSFGFSALFFGIAMVLEALLG